MSNRFYIIVPLLISAVIASLLLVWPKYQNLQVLQTNVSQKEKELQDTKEYFADIKEIHQKLEDEDHKEAFDKIESALPNEASVPSIFHYFQQKTLQTGLGLREISFSTCSGESSSSLNPAIKEINFSISLAGDYQPNLKRFLSTIERSSRLFEVNEISFSSPLDPEESFSFEISLKTHGY